MDDVGLMIAVAIGIPVLAYGMVHLVRLRLSIYEPGNTVPRWYWLVLILALVLLLRWYHYSG